MNFNLINRRPTGSLLPTLRDCVGSSASAAKVAEEQETPVESDDDRLLVPSAKFACFPADISHLVGEYLPMKERSDVETAFAGVEPINFCLSQEVGSKLASCWSIGFLPPNRQWEPSNVKIDKEYLIQDYEGCLELLVHDNPNYCQVVIEVLIVKLSKTLKDLPGALNDLRITIEKLKHHLSSVKHVVISVRGCFSCCFTLKDVFDVETGKLQPVDPVNALITIVKDLKTCWKRKKKLTVFQMFKFYFKRRAKLASKMYLAKFVIPLNTDMNRELFHKEAPKMLSTKIMWICSAESNADLMNIDQDAARLCHAVCVNRADLDYDDIRQLGDRLERAFSLLEENPFVERIFMNFYYAGRTLQLPRPSAPLTKATPRSALIDLTLKGQYDIFDLTQLNNGYFPHLAHFSIIDGKMTGHLDSQSVPRLKTLRIELVASRFSVDSQASSLALEHAQSLIYSGRPWQLVASQDQRGWSLASYDEPIPNPQDEVKEDAPQPLPSLPVIRELMLVMATKDAADEWRAKLKCSPSPKAAAGYQKNGVLVWAPEKVEKITVFSVLNTISLYAISMKIPGQTRILTSLECHKVKVVLQGDVLPRLQSLKAIDGGMNLLGAFPQLKKLSFRRAYFDSLWEVNAPLLESLDCEELSSGDNLFLRPELLPRLSYLRIKPWTGVSHYIPRILVDKDGPGLSHVNHVVLGIGMTNSPDFDQWQLHMVSHLELDVNISKLPVCWEETRWLCDTMTLNFYEPPVEHSDDDSSDDDYSDDYSNDDYSNDDDDSDDKSVPKKKLTVFTFSHMLTCVEKLTVTEDNCKVILDSKLPELTDLFVPSPKSLGPNLLCNKLTCIHYTGKLSAIAKGLCLDRATYKAIHAQPRLVYFGNGSDAKKMSWDVAPNKKKVVLPLDEPLKKGD